LNRVVLDTSVIVEYIDLAGELYQAAETVFSSIRSGRLEAILVHPVLAETYYVSLRLYSQLGSDKPHRRAEKLLEWLFSLSYPAAQSLELAVEAGLVKAKYRLALTDCYVLAASKLEGCKALFLRREREMAKKMESLEHEFNLLFLEDYR